MTPQVPPLLAEGMRKASILWVGAAGYAPRLCWHIWVDDTAWVLHGGPEQDVPVLVSATGEVRLSLRSASTRALLITVAASTEAVPTDSARWAALLPHLQRARLSAPADAPQRWARDCALTGLHPIGEALTTAG